MPVLAPRPRPLLAIAAVALAGSLVAAPGASAAKLESGTASFTLTPRTASLLTGAGVVVTGVDGAALSGRTGTLPVTSGRGFRSPRFAVVRTGGAFVATRGTASLRLQDFRLVGAGRRGAVSVRIGDRRFRVATVRTPRGAFRRSGRTITLRPTALRLTPAAATGIRAVFPDAPVRAGQRFGTLSGSVTLAAPRARR